MPVFFFEIAESRLSLRDERGSTFPDSHTACEEALRRLPAMARGHFDGGDLQRVCLVIRDEAGVVVFSTTLHRADLWTGLEQRETLPDLSDHASTAGRDQIMSKSEPS